MPRVSFALFSAKLKAVVFFFEVPLGINKI